MKRNDVEIRVKNRCVGFTTTNNMTSYLAYDKKISFWSTAEFTKPMLDELDESKLVIVEKYTYDGTSTIRFIKTNEYQGELFIDKILEIIEKYEL